jgi:hypothetical protein
MSRQTVEQRVGRITLPTVLSKCPREGLKARLSEGAGFQVLAV